MGYLSVDKLNNMGFKYLGKNVKISDHATIYNPELIEIGDNSRIDDFCVISGRITIGRYVHITPFCLLAGGIPGVFIADFCTAAYGVKIFAQSDDYTGEAMVNSLIPNQYTKVQYESVSINKHVVLGTGSIVLPGVQIAEGCSFGAMTLVIKSTEPWGVYVGQPAVRKKDRKTDLLLMENAFLKEIQYDTI
jgi:acetyltransferase-like isoleucine patch superfamily enzyme